MCVYCRKEASSVTMMPCFHKIGNVCINSREFQSMHLRCPDCKQFVLARLNKSMFYHTIHGSYKKIVFFECKIILTLRTYG